MVMEYITLKLSGIKQPLMTHEFLGPKLDTPQWEQRVLDLWCLGPQLEDLRLMAEITWNLTFMSGGWCWLWAGASGPLHVNISMGWRLSTDFLQHGGWVLRASKQPERQKARWKPYHLFWPSLGMLPELFPPLSVQQKQVAESQSVVEMGENQTPSPVGRDVKVMGKNKWDWKYHWGHFWKIRYLFTFLVFKKTNYLYYKSLYTIWTD